MTQHKPSDIKYILYPYQKVPLGRPRAQDWSSEIRCCQRHERVLGPFQSATQTVSVGTWDSDPTLPPNKGRLSVISCGPCSHGYTRVSSRFGPLPTCDTPTTAVSVPSMRQNARLRRPEQQKDGGQPWNGGSGVYTIKSRHPRRRVLDPGYSMNPGWIKGRWSGDQNPTDWYVVSKQNLCDIFPQLGHSTPSGHPLRTRSRHEEVGR